MRSFISKWLLTLISDVDQHERCGNAFGSVATLLQHLADRHGEDCHDPHVATHQSGSPSNFKQIL